MIRKLISFRSVSSPARMMKNEKRTNHPSCTASLTGRTKCSLEPSHKPQKDSKFRYGALRPSTYWIAISFASEIAFGGLVGCVPEQKLNLLQLTAAVVTQLRAGSSQFMRGDVR
jgi:hypothetical protein